jgi:hypothetical protein
MAIAIVINFNNNVDPGIRFGPADHWDGYVEDMGRNVFGGIFQGYSLNWGTFDSQGANSPFFNQPYSGYNTNWASLNQDGALGAYVNDKYIGYNTNWGEVKESTDVPPSLADNDLNSVVDHPKTQTIFYKLRGWNPLTLAYEDWVISENITARTKLDGALFDPVPGRSPPNVERDVFKTPPSGNSLINIIITARWIE